LFIVYATGLTRKAWKDKHVSLNFRSVSDEEKKLYNIATFTSVSSMAAAKAGGRQWLVRQRANTKQAEYFWKTTANLMF
jgi:hypothetical protein